MRTAVTAGNAEQAEASVLMRHGDPFTEEPESPPPKDAAPHKKLPDFKARMARGLEKLRAQKLAAADDPLEWVRKVKNLDVGSLGKAARQLQEVLGSTEGAKDAKKA